MSSRVSARARETSSWWLAPLLAVLALGVHELMDVPHAEMLLRDEPQLVGDAGKTPAAKSKAKLGKARKQGRSYVARDAAKLDALRKRWSKQPIESEPTDQSFRRYHEAMLRSLVTHLRTKVLASKNPPPMQIRPSCRSVRCALELCGDQALLVGVAERLPTITVEGASLWHELREIEPTREPPKRDSKQNQVCRRWMLDFAVEGVTVAELEIAEPDEGPRDTDTE